MSARDPDTSLSNWKSSRKKSPIFNKRAQKLFKKDLKNRKSAKNGSVTPKCHLIYYKSGNRKLCCQGLTTLHSATFCNNDQERAVAVSKGFWNSKGHLWKDEICGKADCGVTEAMPESSVTHRFITIFLQCTKTTLGKTPSKNAQKRRRYWSLA